MFYHIMTEYFDEQNYFDNFIDFSFNWTDLEILEKCGKNVVLEDFVH